MASKKPAAKEREVLVIASKVKEFIKEQGCMTAAETIPALSEKVYELLEAAIKRTQENKRSTVKPYDL